MRCAFEATINNSRLMQGFARRVPLIVLVCVFSALVWWSRHHVFFWDTVSQASLRSTWFYQQGFRTLFLPPSLDSGHPPLFNWYLAAGWLLWERSLPVSHALMWPVLMFIAWQWQRLFSFFQATHPALPAGLALLPLLDTTLLSQASLVSVDLAMLACTLAGLNAILRKQAWALFFALAPLGLLNLRGLPAGASLGLCWLWCRLSANETRRATWRALWPLAGAAVVWGVWFFAHYLEAGWLLATPNPRWAEHRQASGWTGLLWNAGITGWRLLDYGRIGYWLVLAVLLFRRGLGRWLVTPLPLFVGSYMIVHALAMWPVSNPITHRYFMPVFVVLPMWLAMETWRAGPALRRWALPLMACFLLGGHFIVYPRGIAQGWDGTTAHWPWYTLRQRMLDTLAHHQIPWQAVGTRFPAAGPFDKFDLSGRQQGLSPLDWKDHPYILYSNVMNDFTDEELRRLDSLPAQWQFEKRGICVKLYRNEPTHVTPRD